MDISTWTVGQWEGNSFETHSDEPFTFTSSSASSSTSSRSVFSATETHTVHILEPHHEQDDSARRRVDIALEHEEIVILPHIQYGDPAQIPIQDCEEFEMAIRTIEEMATTIQQQVDDDIERGMALLEERHLAGENTVASPCTPPELL
jgi:hypothetical protein